MKKLLMGLALAAGLMTNAAHAQDNTAQREPRTPEERADRLTAMMNKRLVLTPEEMEKVKTINRKYADEAKAVKDERKDQKGAKPGAMKDMKAQKNAELKQVLTPEQYTKWLSMEEKMVEKRKEHRQARKGEQQPDQKQP